MKQEVCVSWLASYVCRHCSYERRNHWWNFVAAMVRASFDAFLNKQEYIEEVFSFLLKSFLSCTKMCYGNFIEATKTVWRFFILHLIQSLVGLVTCTTLTVLIGVGASAMRWLEFEFSNGFLKLGQLYIHMIVNKYPTTIYCQCEPDFCHSRF